LLNNKIFTIATGRSGIHYLSSIFKECCGIRTAEIEPLVLSPRDISERRKIANDVWESLPDTYIDTNLQTKNGYLHILANMGARFIYLKREFHNTAYSWYRLNGVPGRTPRGLSYHPIPTDDTNCILLNDVDSIDDYGLCLWLCYEVEARAKRIKELGHDVYFVDVEDLHFEDNVKALLDWCKVEYDITTFKSNVFNSNKNRNSYFNQVYYNKESHEELSLAQRVQSEKNVLSRMVHNTGHIDV